MSDKDVQFPSLKKREISFNIDKDSHGWIQWKGTDACIDIHCKICNHMTHIDDSFTYYIQCPYCKTVFEANGFIELIPIDGITDFKVAKKDVMGEEFDLE